MLPTTVDDYLSGPLVQPVVESLIARVDGGHEPIAAHIVPVPKRRRVGARPIAVLTLTDRILYDALGVAALRQAGLLFEARSPLGWIRALSRDRYVVEADVANYGASIPHDQLVGALGANGAPARILDGLSWLLERMLPGGRGLPAGAQASYLIGQAYLVSASRDLRGCYDGSFFWKADNFYVAVDGPADADAVVATIEAAISDLGLELNQAKTRVRSVAEALPSQDGWKNRLQRRRFHVGRIGARQLAAAATAYLHEFQGQLGEEQARRLTHALSHLTRAADPSGLAHVGELLATAPFVTPPLAAYLHAMLRGPHAGRAADTIEAALLAGMSDPWEEAWMLRTLQAAPQEASDAVLRYAAEVSHGPEWVRAVEALRLRASRAEDVSDDLEAAWAAAPVPMRAGLLAIPVMAAVEGQRAMATFFAGRADEPSALLARARRGEPPTWWA
jgi:hypothetical protein